MTPEDGFHTEGKCPECGEKWVRHMVSPYGGMRFICPPRVVGNRVGDSALCADKRERTNVKTDFGATPVTEKDELVEVVARAMAEGEMLDCQPGDCEDCDSWRTLARAAIASIRPTIVEEVLRELAVWLRDRDELSAEGAVLSFATVEHGLDLTQDGGTGD